MASQNLGLMDSKPMFPKVQTGYLGGRRAGP